jgi:translation initiation factor 2 alpha subunit (eIF-2alpha)
MATTTKRYDARKALGDYYVYAPLGAGQLLLEKSREFSGKAFEFAQSQREDWVKSYQDLAKRGEKLVVSIRRSAPTRRAIDQTKVARSQVKAATTTVRKAATTAAEATRQAAKKVG